MNQIHLDNFIKLSSCEQDYLGNNSLKWGNYVLPDTKIDNYLNKQLNRYELFDYSQNLKIDNLNVLVAILSWGGMNRRHAVNLFSNPITLMELVNNLRNRVYQTRQSAFEAFQIKRENGLLPGLGIGYYTKLICFLSPQLNGYIMDQWVSKSINLLTGEKIVSLSNYKGRGWVNDNNNYETYETLCSKIDQLATILGCSGFEAEKRLFSIGKGQGAWRNYLIQNYFI